MTRTLVFRLGAIATAAVLAPSPVLAEPRLPVDVPGGQLGRGLVLLSQQTNEDIGTADPALPLRRTPGVHGRYTVKDALRRLLDPAGAFATRTGPHSWRIAARAPTAPPRTATAAPRIAPIAVPAEPQVIVVTGVKRAVPLRDYPGSVAILHFEGPGNAGPPAGMEAIANASSTIFSTQFGPGRDKLFVRGIVDSAFSGPNQTTTGLYLNDTRLTYNSPDPNLRLYDVERVEVLEGPQGALYGAGSLGGVIHIVTVKPKLEDVSARVSAGVSVTSNGSPGDDLATAINVPLAGETSAARLVVYRMDDGGYIDDPLGHRENINRIQTVGARGGLRVASGDWLIDIDGAWQGIRGADSQWTEAGPGSLQRSGAPLGYRSNYLFGGLTVSRDWGPVDFVSTTSVSHQYLLERFDASSAGSLPTTARQVSRTTLFANEARLSRSTPDAAGWLVGLSLLRNRSAIERVATDSSGGTTPHEYARNDAWEETLFGEAGIRLAKGLVATLGARLTNAQSDGSAVAYLEATTIPIFDNPVSGHGRSRKFRIVPTVALSGRPKRGLLLFARLQQGFRPGGFGISNSRAREYQGDRLTTLEAGIRIGEPGSRLQVAAALSLSDWRNILAEVVSQGGDPVTQNIGNGRIGSVETDLTWRPTPRLSVNAGLFANRSRLYGPTVTSVVVSHRALPNLARFSARAAVGYSLPLKDSKLTFSGSAKYLGGSHLGAGPILDAAQGDYFTSELLLAWSRGGRTMSLSVSNPLNAKANRFALGTPYQIYAAQATPLRPLTIRVGIDLRM